MTMSKHGWIAPNWPRAYGGMGLDTGKMLILLEEGERYGVARVPDHVLVVADEAYFEFVTDPEYPNALDYVDLERPLVVLRTFSKIYSLAGLRVGYGVFPGPLARAVWMLAWPTMLQNLISGLQPMVDHALVGHLVGYAGNAAIGVAIQIFIVVPFGRNIPRPCVIPVAGSSSQSGGAAAAGPRHRRAHRTSSRSPPGSSGRSPRPRRWARSGTGSSP